MVKLQRKTGLSMYAFVQLLPYTGEGVECNLLSIVFQWLRIMGQDFISVAQHLPDHCNILSSNFVTK